MSTIVTSGFAAFTLRVTGSAAATGKLAQVCTVRATLVPSTSTWSRARCSLSVATSTTESSAITPASLQESFGLSRAPITDQNSATCLCQTSSDSSTAVASWVPWAVRCSATHASPCTTPSVPNCFSASSCCGRNSLGSVYLLGQEFCCKCRSRGCPSGRQ